MCRLIKIYKKTTDLTTENKNSYTSFNGVHPFNVLQIKTILLIFLARNRHQIFICFTMLITKDKIRKYNKKTKTTNAVKSLSKTLNSILNAVHDTV